MPIGDGSTWWIGLDGFERVVGSGAMIRTIDFFDRIWNGSTER